jgi:hypothetical protein
MMVKAVSSRCFSWEAPALLLYEAEVFVKLLSSHCYAGKVSFPGKRINYLFILSADYKGHQSTVYFDSETARRTGFPDFVAPLVAVLP